MSFDYDLVILGGSLAARYAAARASHLRARVALVEPDAPQTVELAVLQQGASRQLKTLVQSLEKAASWGIGPTPFPAQDRGAAHDFVSLNWEKSLKWVRETTEMIAANEVVGYSLSQLAACGVDVVLGEAAFEPASRQKSRSIAPRPSTPSSTRSSTRSWNRLIDHPPVVLAGGRYLRSRRYLLAPATTATIPHIEGLATIPYRTVDTFWQNPWADLPRHLTILGSDPRGIELAQLFNRLGCRVSLIVSGTQLLPNEDATTFALLQALLEAEGIEILTQTRITQVKQLNNQTWIQAGDRALQTDALLLATRTQADLAAFNVQAVGVEVEPSLRVNRRLQTTNPYIYACGDGLGGYTLPHLAEHEAEVALKNALFCPTAQVNYRQIPWAIFTSPTFASVGLTESQARALYGAEVVIVQQSLQPLSLAQVEQETTGLCKLIVRRNGEILGAHSLAPQAEEWMGAIALAMQHRLKLGAIDPSTFLSSTFSEILAHLMQQWQFCRRPAWQRDLWESWFNLRRS